MEEILKKRGVERFAFLPFKNLVALDEKSLYKIPKGCRACAVMVFPYYSKSAFSGNISGYCAVPDYHKQIGMQLKSICRAMSEKYPGEVFAPFVDNSPIDEVYRRVRAGLGVKGRNGLLITPEYGSFVFIAEILTTLKVDCAPKPYKTCPDCGRCAEACPGGALCKNKRKRPKPATLSGETLWDGEFFTDAPTDGTYDTPGEEDALTDPWRDELTQYIIPRERESLREKYVRELKTFSTPENLRLRKRTKGERGAEYVYAKDSDRPRPLNWGEVDREKCASALGQKKGELTREEEEIIRKSGYVFGCDICQLVCPMNRHILNGEEPVQPDPEAGHLFSKDIINTLTKENAEKIYKDRAFGWRGLKVLLRNLEIFEDK